MIQEKTVQRIAGEAGVCTAGRFKHVVLKVFRDFYAKKGAACDFDRFQGFVSQEWSSTWLFLKFSWALYVGKSHT